MMIFSKYASYLSVLFLTISLWSCQEDEEVVVPQQPTTPPVDIASDGLRDTTFKIMQEWYLWNDQMPAVDPADYGSADELLNALRFERDKWSYITEEKEYDDYFKRGEYQGYGYGPAFDAAGDLRVSLVYDDSPFGRAGVERGWVVRKINGTPISRSSYTNDLLEAPTNTFEFVTPTGAVVTKTLTKTTVGINTVLDYQVLRVDEQPVGYLAFNGFIEKSIDELKPAFEAFQQAQITDLVLDLRYNGGGRIDVAEYIATNLIGTRGTDRVFAQDSYNPTIQEGINAAPEILALTTRKFAAPEFPLDLNRLVVITSGRTASASELLINGLSPFMDVLIVGENTYGKPVGSRPFRYGGYAISPIILKIVNDNGEGEYYEGFAPDALVADDLSYNFGDPREARLKEALHFIETGAFSDENARRIPLATEQPIEFSGFQREIGTL
jgi:C-terminal processing protease CtpA/Prc